MASASGFESAANDPPLLLIGGVNFSTWPDLKWARANSYASALQADLAVWGASAPISVEGVLREDRRAIDFVAGVPHGIPKHQWALGLGDTVHNLRSAFDAVAWGMAHYAGASPRRPKSIQFPICHDEERWDQALRSWIGELPSELQSRLRLLQPIGHVSPGQPWLLSMLHELDIRDKHRDILEVSADVHSIDVSGAFEYEHIPEAESASPNLRIDPTARLVDGAVLGTLEAGAPIRLMHRMILRPSVQLRLEYQGSTYDVTTLLPQLLAETRRYLDILLTGLAPSAPDGEGWEPVRVET